VIQFPPDLVPNHTQMIAMPIKPSAFASTPNGQTGLSLLLSDTSSGGQLELLFDAHSVKSIKPINCPPSTKVYTGEDSWKNLARAAVGTRAGVYGWADVFKFYDQVLRSGHLMFEIPSTHILWDTIDYKAEWLELSLAGNLGIWKIMEPPMILNSRSPRQYCNFSIKIKHFLRSPAWV
jgi:hypothetical protein